MLSSKRDQAKLIVSLSPGIHLRKLQKLLGTSFSTTRYHVDGLERDGEIVRSKDGRYDRLYPAGTAERMKPLYAALQSKTARKILKTLVETGAEELTSTDLSGRLNLPRSSLSEYLTQLSSVHVLRRSLVADGRTLYQVQDAEEVSRLLSSFERNMLSIATDGFIDLWEL